MRFSISTGGSRLTSTFPIPQLMADIAVRHSPTAVRSCPTVTAITARPANATAVPDSWRRVGFSFSARPAKRMVKRACVWTTIDAKPGGIPLAMPKNWKRNCPANNVRPAAHRTGQVMGGRATSTTGTEAIRNRKAVS